MMLSMPSSNFEAPLNTTWDFMLTLNLKVTSCCFWSQVILTAVSIWSATAFDPDDYASFMASRAVLGVFCPTAQILTNGVIINIFFLHERGRAFAIHAAVYTLATLIGPIFSGFVSGPLKQGHSHIFGLTADLRVR